jgi:hypothetical protein
VVVHRFLLKCLIPNKKDLVYLRLFQAEQLEPDLALLLVSFAVVVEPASMSGVATGI